MEAAESKVAELVRKITEAEQALKVARDQQVEAESPHSKLRKKPPARKDQIQA